MSSTKENTGMLRSICRIMGIVLVIFVVANTAHAQTPQGSAATAKPAS